MAKQVDAFGADLAHINPAEALQEELNRCRGNVLAINEILAQRGIENLMVEVSEETRTGGLDPGTTKRVSNVIGPFVEVYLKEREQLHRVARTAMQTNLAAWRIHIEERQIDLMELGMLAALRELGYSADDPRTRAAMATGLRAMQVAGTDRQLGAPAALLKPPKRSRV